MSIPHDDPPWATLETPQADPSTGPTRPSSPGLSISDPADLPSFPGEEAKVTSLKAWGGRAILLAPVLAFVLFFVVMFVNDNAIFTAVESSANGTLTGLITGTLSLCLFLWGFTGYARRSAVQRIQTSTTDQLPVGPVELSGRAIPAYSLVAPHSKRPCVYYRYELQELRQRRRRGLSFSDRSVSTYWVSRGTFASSPAPFYLDDGRGHVMVDPDGADFVLKGKLEVPISNRQNLGGLINVPRRVLESIVAPGAQVYLLGEVTGRSAGGGNPAAQRLKALKNNPEEMARFDRDGDGHIDGMEWEEARKAVQAEAEQQAGGDPSDCPWVGKGKGRVPYMISTYGEKHLSNRLITRFLAGTLGGALLAVATVMLIW